MSHAVAAHLAGIRASDGTVDSIIATNSITMSNSNAAPAVNVGDPYTVAEGGAVRLTAIGSDPDGCSVSYAWDPDNDSTFETARAQPSRP
jgi:hypothetical protein